MAETTESPETNPFIRFDTAAMLGFWHKQYGEAAFRELLALSSSQAVPKEPWTLRLEERVKITTREALEGIACQLDSRGLKKLAKIVREHAAGRPREIDLPPYEPGSTNHRAWLAAMKYR